VECVRFGNGAEDREAIHIGHLHIEKDEIGSECSESVDRLGARSGLGDCADLRVAVEKAPLASLKTPEAAPL